MLLPQGVSCRGGKVVKGDPNITSGRTGEVFPPDLLVLLWEVRIDAIRIECLRIAPLNLGSLWIDFQPSFFADCEPLFPCHLVSRWAHISFLSCSMGNLRIAGGCGLAHGVAPNVALTRSRSIRHSR